MFLEAICAICRVFMHLFFPFNFLSFLNFVLLAPVSSQFVNVQIEKLNFSSFVKGNDTYILLHAIQLYTERTYLCPSHFSIYYGITDPQQKTARATQKLNCRHSKSSCDYRDAEKSCVNMLINWLVAVCSRNAIVARMDMKLLSQELKVNWPTTATSMCHFYNGLAKPHVCAVQLTTCHVAVLISIQMDN